MSEIALILEPESSGLRLLPAATRLGLHPVVFDHRDLAELSAPARDAVTAGMAAYQRVDTRDVASTREAARRLHRGQRVGAVLPGFEYAVPVAAAVADDLGVPGIDPRRAEDLRDKRRMKEALLAAGVPVASGTSIDLATWDGLSLPDIDYPAVVKPADGSGSLLVQRVDDAAGLQRFLDALQAGTVESMGRPIGARLLVEPYLTGPEFSVEGFVADGQVSVVSVTGKHLGPEPFFVETGHTVEADIAPTHRTALAALAVDAVRALGLTVGVFHTEARICVRGPVLIEVGARLAGDHIPRLIEMARGVDLAGTAVAIAAARPTPPPARPTSQVAGVRFFTVTEPARLTGRADVEKRLLDLPGTQEVVWRFPAEARLRPPTDWSDRYGHHIAVADDHAALRATFEAGAQLRATALQPL